MAVVGPATWNDIIVLDHLPDPVPHMQFARAAWSTMGGTSAGKALHLAALGIPCRLHAFLGPDQPGRRVAEGLRGAGVDLVTHASSHTERHVNLMTEDGARVSLYVAVPSAPTGEALAAVSADLRQARHAIVDLSEAGAAIIESVAAAAGDDRPTVWVDLHDYDGDSSFHEPFVRSADIVFMNADAVDDPEALARACVAKGPRLAVCTLGADGALAVDATGLTARAPAPSVERVVDTNGAGDAFMAGFLAARLRGLAIDECLRDGSSQAAVALSTRHLHPSVAPSDG